MFFFDENELRVRLENFTSPSAESFSLGKLIAAQFFLSQLVIATDDDCCAFGEISNELWHDCGDPF